MASTLAVLTILPAVIAVVVIVRAGAHLRGTSLRLAWGWGVVASLAVTLAWVATAAWPLVPSPWDDMLWYAVVELLLCPLIAVLGARRPGVAVWNWFVLLPLLAVLGWPVAAVALAGARPGSFMLETPPLIGICLVLVMGAGNYLGTRFRLPVAGLVSVTVVFIISSLVPGTTRDPNLLRMLAVWCVGFAAATGWRAARHPTPANSGPDRAWRDFRDLFGIVWAQRIRDRMNERASQEQWPVRLELHGFVAPGEPADADAADDDPRIERALRWLLRRFVDEAWLNQRLGTTPAADRRSVPAVDETWDRTD